MQLSGRASACDGKLQPVLAAKCVTRGLAMLPNVSAQARPGGIDLEFYGDIARRAGSWLLQGRGALQERFERDMCDFGGGGGFL
ncbi:hypothetical protein BwSH20_14400 [Bradyrhizobium ottawaense]|nr:hypothetical protein TM102_59010 [Bradyrhizobium sp. TM102]GMO15176.1 hypothetical protein BwSF21_04390 [Bradyrhizobium ottawaense]GMO40200.1 hypothetical protein BwSH14_51060 [Bradyrhizobium ottawaense]GMO68758.1 hypothetical protein BwSH17_23310 [Bradyrhizobium ottawaense]GMO96123.1 hypothetical protein BwSH20_14400 [Bradyrhizobium ottawaense]